MSDTSSAGEALGDNAPAASADAKAGDGTGTGAAVAAPETVERASFDNLAADTAPAPSADVSLDMILDVPVNLTLEVGRTRMNVRDLLQLTNGSVVELDRLSGEPMDVLVNGTLVATGEVVVVDDRFGVRLTDVVSPAQRIRHLN